MRGKRVLITGATSGIGKAAAAALVAKGAHVGIVGRNPARTEAAAAELGAADVFLGDLSELDDVRAVAAEVARCWAGVDVLVNNAGINRASTDRTSDGLDPMVATNFLAPFLLTNLLVAPLEAAAPARVVNVASEAHRIADRIDPATIASWGPARGVVGQNRLYGRTKLALLLVTQEQARRLAGERVDVNACCPGLVATNLAGTDAAITHASTLLARTPLVRRAEQGAAVLVRLACDPELTGATGGFHSSTPAASLIPKAGPLRDADLQRRLWAAAAELVGLPSR
ncbi:MAG: SDR family NAD(P)-dependent oxidoreductase [Acidimicrobiia bacterium]|nr:SDR family NAD(P)-dependent oxidoreductase [Acidimicrobiia bacterium]